MDLIELNWNGGGSNGTKMGLKWTTEDRIRPKWTKQDRRGQNWIKQGMSKLIALPLDMAKTTINIRNYTMNISNNISKHSTGRLGHNNSLDGPQGITLHHHGMKTNLLDKDNGSTSS